MAKTLTSGARPIRVGAIVLVPQLVADLGHDPDKLFKAVALHPADLADPEATIAMDDFERLFAAAIRLTGHRDLGLRIGRRAGSAYMGAVRDRMAAEPDLRSAIMTLIRLAPVNIRVGGPYLVTDEAEARLELGSLFQTSAVAASFDDGIVLTTFYLLRGLLGGAWRPRAIELSHAPNAPVADYRAAFGLTPRFQHTRSAIVMPLTDLDRPMLASDTSRADPTKRAALIIAQRREQSLLDQSRALIRVRLSEPSLDLFGVAAELGLSGRTLNRRLQANGTSFAALLAETREAVARHLLAETETPVGLIAIALGYADQSVFARAFRKRVGTSPRNWRAANRR